MITVTIDGREVTVAEGTNLVEAARRAGIEIPTYCYHPGLSVVGQCRICFVEVEGMPRLVTACSTRAADGMVVHTASDRVKEARAAVMEFLLANHPLDCPVCDQAGECYLQDYSFEHGLDTTHMVDERRTFPGLERRLIGPHVVQNQNRCIHCTRCIRFTQEISETHDLTMKSRGNHQYIDTFDGQPFDNPWSACAADVCPVGALTVREFRFRARVWHLERTPSVCFGCSIGCSIWIDHHEGIVHRFVPRESPEINGWWMCDHGRFLCEELNARDLARPAADGDDIGWPEALDRLAELLRADPRPRVVLSANLHNEALYLAKRIFMDELGLETVVPVHEGPERRIRNARREWIVRRDAHPNATGARLVGLPLCDVEGLRAALSGGPAVLLDELAHPWLASEEAAATVSGPVAVLARRETPLVARAALRLPEASWIETEGTVTSSTGRVQLAQRGLFPRGEARPAWEVLSLLAVRLGLEERHAAGAREVFEAMVAEVPAFAGMTWRRLEREPSGIPALEEVADVG